MRSYKDEVSIILLCNYVLVILFVFIVKRDIKRKWGGGGGRNIYMRDKG